jgi:hypothetical protein
MVFVIEVEIWRRCNGNITCNHSEISDLIYIHPLLEPLRYLQPIIILPIVCVLLSQHSYPPYMHMHTNFFALCFLVNMQCHVHTVSNEFYCCMLRSMSIMLYNESIWSIILWSQAVLASTVSPYGLVILWETVKFTRCLFSIVFSKIVMVKVKLSLCLT